MTGKATVDPPNVLSRDCGSRFALDRIAGKWTVLLVYALADGPRRHGELRRAVDGISQKMLTQTLRVMERDGLITRTVKGQVPPHVEYALTPLGTSLTEPLVALCKWTMRHLPEIEFARAAHPNAQSRLSNWRLRKAFARTQTHHCRAPRSSRARFCS